VRKEVLVRYLKTMVVVSTWCLVFLFVFLPKTGMAQQISSLVDLLRMAEDHDLARNCDEEVLSIGKIDRSDPAWPVHVFLRAEIHLLRDEPAKARFLYRKIVNWAASDPYGDTWGASSLAPVSLWRWSSLCLSDDEISEDEISSLIFKADILLPTRFTLQLSHYTGLGRLPLVYEAIISNLTRLAVASNNGSAEE